MGEVTVRTNLKIDEVHVLRVPHLNDELPDLDAKICNTVRLGQRDDSGAKLPYNNLITKDAVILGDIVRVGGHAPVSRGFVRAGVRPSLYFDPATTKAAIVTCGGLCPGLNNVIRQIVRDLHYLYGVDTVLGIRDGFSGFHDGTPPRLLTMDFVKSMHRFGGSCIGSGRGGFDAGKIIKFLQDNAVNVLFVVGGDGTLRAANALHTEVHARNLPICIAGVPKTIGARGVRVACWMRGGRCSGVYVVCCLLFVVVVFVCVCVVCLLWGRLGRWYHRPVIRLYDGRRRSRQSHQVRQNRSRVGQKRHRPGESHGARSWIHRSPRRTGQRRCGRVHRAGSLRAPARRLWRIPAHQAPVATPGQRRGGACGRRLPGLDSRRADGHRCRRQQNFACVPSEVLVVVRC